MSNQMLSGIPEVDLGIDAKIKNIEATEEAKQKLLQDQKNRKDAPSAFVPTNMAVNFVQHNRCKDRIYYVIVRNNDPNLCFLFQLMSTMTRGREDKTMPSHRNHLTRSRKRRPQTIITTISSGSNLGSTRRTRFLVS